MIKCQGCSKTVEDFLVEGDVGDYLMTELTGWCTGCAPTEDLLKVKTFIEAVKRERADCG